MSERSESPPEPADVTLLLQRAREGDARALENVFPLVYDQLQDLAGRQLRRERPGHTLQATDLVHEAYMKLVGGGDVDWRDRAHFLGIAARAMRQVLVDHARRRQAAKRGGGARPTTLTGKGLGESMELDELLDLDRALDRLEAMDPRLRQVVEYRYFGGLKDAEIGELLGVTRRTVQRDWARARAWLYRELYGDGGASAEA